jgi:hypothetical protein
MGNLEQHVQAIVEEEHRYGDLTYSRVDALKWIAEDPEGLWTEEYKEEARQALGASNGKR